MHGMTVGFALCGSFCTFHRVIPQMRALRERGAQIVPILSDAAWSTDTRFGKAADFRREIEAICQKEIIHTLTGAEPIGPQKLLDLLIIAPCTGNTLGKLASAVTDSSVTLAAKAHLRNERPLLLAVSTNDALSGSAESIGRLLARRHVYFVPMGQDAPQTKPTSVVADFARLPDAAALALQEKQLQPILL